MKTRSRDAFTLIELLVVMAIGALLIGISSMAFSKVMVGSELTRGGQIVADMMTLARQEAVTRNVEVQARFYQLPDRPGYTAVQLWRVYETPLKMVEAQLSTIRKLPEAVQITDNDSLSPLLKSDTTISGSATIPGVTTPVNYRGFRFRPTGALNIAVSDRSKSFVTLIGKNVTVVTGTPPVNYYTVSINPITGRVAVYRP